MPLTDTAIRNVKPRDRAYKMYDSGGLHVYVTPAGSRLWRMRYTHQGKEKLLSFGPYPLVGLKDAREKRDAAQRLLLEDRDPSEERRLARLRREAERAVTFGAVTAEYLDKVEKEGRSPATMKKLRWPVAQTRPDLHQLPIMEIEPSDFLRLLKSIETRGAYEMTRRLRATIGTVFRYAIAMGRTQRDPTEALKGSLVQPTVRPWAGILDRREFGALLNRIEGADGQPATRIALLLLALLAPRPGELRLSSWDEFDLDDAVWRVPAARMRVRRPHRVPLPPQAISLLRELHRHTGTSVFPSAV